MIIEHKVPTPSLDQIKAYLIQHGWQVVGEAPSANGTLYHKWQRGAVEVWFPVTDGDIISEMYAFDIIRKLSYLEGRSEYSIWKEIGDFELVVMFHSAAEQWAEKQKRDHTVA